MGLHLHRSERADPLVRELAAVLGAAPPDPFTPDVVAVPARGIERWLTQRLSHHLGAGEVGRGGDGVCANIRFPAPSALVAGAIAAASGVDPGDDPWSSGRVTWTLLGVIDDCVDQQWCAQLTRHLEGDEGSVSWRPGRRFVLAQRVADLFAAYGEQRPAMLREWAAGRDRDGAGAALAEDFGWQPELWRRLRARLQLPSPAERLDEASAVLRATPEVVDLPDRLSLFGPTRLTTEQVGVLVALAAHRAVHLWLPHPSAAQWDRVATQADGLVTRPRRRDDPTVGLVAHPLLASLGRDSRELQLMLSSATEETAAEGTATEEMAGSRATDRHHALDQPPATLLGRLQHDLRRNVCPAGAPLGGADDTRHPLDPADRSLQVHACHGRARQVEVLREVLLGLLRKDPSLEPRDVVVMCPDIESYAPLISATFGLADGDQTGTSSGCAQPAATHPGQRLRVRLADRSLRQTNPLLATVSRLLELADARVTASQLFDFAASPPVRRRFGLDDDELERVRGWVSTAGVRWGLDAARRVPYRMEHTAQNTWAAGLDRVLLGATMSEDDRRWLGLALPLDDVGSGDIDLAGRLAELVDRLVAVLGSLTGELALTRWLSTLTEALDSLTAVADRDGWQLSQARRELGEVAATAGEHGGRTALGLADVRALLADRLRGRPTRAGFRTGNLTMCSMVPMRSVPHRVICLLGLDDGVFPRTRGVDGDDILAHDPLIGERDRRSEDRQLLLDAVLAAQDHLVILYTGADERTNTLRPPAVPVGELLDVTDATARGREGAPACDQVVVRHPLQPFDARNFASGALGADGPFSFDRSALAGALAAAQPRRGPTPFLTRRLDPAPSAGGEVALDDLLRFLAHPVREFLRQRLGVTVRAEEDDLSDALVTELEGLDKWGVGTRWVRARLARADADLVRQVEWRRGTLPPGALGARALDAVTVQADALVATARDGSVDDPRAVDVMATLPSGRTVLGTVGAVHRQTVRRVEFSRLGPKHRLPAWAQVLGLAASASTPGSDRTWQAVTIGRDSTDSVLRSTITAPPAAAAAAALDDLVAVYLMGLREPLPLPVDESHAYADLRRAGRSTSQAGSRARSRWGGEFGGGADRYHRLVWGDDPPFDLLLDAPSTVDSEPAGGAPSGAEPTRFGALARRLWQPLFDAEVLEAVGPTQPSATAEGWATP